VILCVSSLFVFDKRCAIVLLFFLPREKEKTEEKKKSKKKGKIIPRPHYILFEPTETLAKNTKKKQKPPNNARKKMLRPPVESAFSTLTREESPGGNSLAVL
jgi:hypothetical protein